MDPNPQQPNTASAISQKSKASTLPLILTSIGLVILLIVCGAVGYLYKTTSDQLADANQSLRVTTKELSVASAELKKSKEAGDFVAKYNDAQLSRQSCNGASLLMSDVHVNDKFVVYRYLCAGGSDGILLGAFAKHKDGTIDFTYGSSSAKPNSLPGYIFDSEPEFFGSVYKTIRF